MMTEEMTKVTIKIDGCNYNIRGMESAEYLEGLGRLVEAKIAELRQELPYYGAVKLAVLAALQFADDKCKAEEKYRELTNEIDELLGGA